MTIKEIELHPGHWENTGSGVNSILKEVPEARKVTKRVYTILKENNVPCTYFEDNTSSSQNQNIHTLIKHHNEDRNGLIVSIHFNSGGDSSKGIGTEALYYDQKALAERISKAISDATSGGLKNRGAKQRKDLGVLARTYEPSILIEVCFVNSVIDAAIYRRDFEKICQAIAGELAAVLGKSIKSTNKKESVRMYKPSPSMKESAMKVLKRLENKEVHGDKAISSIHREKLAKDELSLDDAVGLLFVAHERGLFVGK